MLKVSFISSQICFVDIGALLVLNSASKIKKKNQERIVCIFYSTTIEPYTKQMCIFFFFENVVFKNKDV